MSPHLELHWSCPHKGHRRLTLESSGSVSASLVDSSCVDSSTQQEFLPSSPLLQPPSFCWWGTEHKSGFAWPPSLLPLHLEQNTDFLNPQTCTLSSWEPCSLLQHIPVKPASRVLTYPRAPGACFYLWFYLPRELIPHLPWLAPPPPGLCSNATSFKTSVTKPSMWVPDTPSLSPCSFSWNRLLSLHAADHRQSWAVNSLAYWLSSSFVATRLWAPKSSDHGFFIYHSTPSSEPVLGM